MLSLFLIAHHYNAFMFTYYIQGIGSFQMEYKFLLGRKIMIGKEVKILVLEHITMVVIIKTIYIVPILSPTRIKLEISQFL